MVNWPAICAAAIPCLNESATIGRIVRDVRTHLGTVIVVDDEVMGRTKPNRFPKVIQDIKAQEE